MRLGAFSVSLPVGDLARSRDFYARLGFEPVGGAVADGYLVLRNGAATIGLFRFEGMDFDQPMLTFNPGDDLAPGEDFDDVRAIRERLVAAGVDLDADLDPAGRGPAHLALRDPDGHRLLIDQFVDAPADPAGPADG